MRSKRIITLLLMMSFALTMLSACADTNDGSNAVTTETPDINSVVTEQPEDTTGDKTETTIPQGVDIELYNAAKEALIELDDITKNEIRSVYEKNGSKLEWSNIEDYNFVVSGTTRCYGEFDRCIVLFEPTEFTSLFSLKIGDIEFEYPYSYALWGYCDGTLYSLKDAFELGYIGKNDVALAARRHKNVEEYIQEYGKRIAEIECPEEKLIEQIEEDYLKLISQNNSYNSSLDGPFTVKRYYGIYNSAVAVVIGGHGVTALQKDEEIAGSILHFPSGYSIMVWFNGQFCALKQAYEQGILTADNITEIAIINNFEKDIKYS